jgi:methionyl-tRNA formyltransferase
MPAKKIVFLGSKPIGYECLAYLIAQKEALNLDITGIRTRSRKEFGEGHDLTELAGKNNIPVLSNLNDLPECAIIYSVQYHELLKPKHIQKAKELCVNLHMAPLPEYRGANQFSFAILDRKKEFGTTIHKIDTRIDHGDILFQKRFPIPDDCWVGELYELTFKASVYLFKETLADVVTGNYTPIPQESLVAKYGTSLHYRKEMADIKMIDMAWDKEKIDRHVRATAMPGFEPPYYLENGEKVYLTPDP